MLRLGTLFSVLAAAACGSSPSIGYSELDEALHRARCERLTRCKLFPDEATCLAYERPAPDPSVAGAIGAGKIKYDGARAQQCVDAAARQSCDLTARDVRTPAAACEEMYGGTVAGGDRCSIDAECASGTCELPAQCPELMCCVGACRAPQAPSAASGPCAKDRDCSAGLVCGANHQCREPGLLGDTCRAEHECGAGLSCVGVGTPSASCRALPHAGERCPDQRCADLHLRCDPLTITCVAVGLLGDPCPTSAECSIGMECDATTHACRPYPGLGMPCDGTCTGASFCQIVGTATRGTCVALLPNNSPCDGNQQCASGFCEDGPVFRGCIDPYVCF